METRMTAYTQLERVDMIWMILCFDQEFGESLVLFGVEKLFDSKPKQRAEFLSHPTKQTKYTF